MIMPSSHSSSLFHYLVGKYPGKLGWLVGPSSKPKTALRKWVPFALDNDAFPAWKQNKPWDADAWYEMLIWVKQSGLTPLWVLCPDVVTNREATIDNWSIYSPLIKSTGWPCAFAVQDGMTPADVPHDADVVFVGGSTDWKWSTVPQWAASFPHVHIGRVNSIERASYCQSLGVKSIDGTGWFRDASRKDRDLAAWLEQTATA